jgi:hypothetical protein
VPWIQGRRRTGTAARDEASDKYPAVDTTGATAVGTAASLISTHLLLVIPLAWNVLEAGRKQQKQQEAATGSGGFSCGVDAATAADPEWTLAWPWCPLSFVADSLPSPPHQADAADLTAEDTALRACIRKSSLPAMPLPLDTAPLPAADRSIL